MSIDNYPVPAEHKVYVRQNIFPGVYHFPRKDSIAVNLYQDFSYSMIGQKGYFAMASGVNVILNNVFEFGPFCNYIPGIVNLPDNKNTLILSTYFYCGSMFGFVPLSGSSLHPKLSLDVALGNASGVSQNKLNTIQTNVNYVFFVLKPVLALEMNLFSFLQWTAAVQYRFQFNLHGPSDNLGSKAQGLEISTGPVIHL